MPRYYVRRETRRSSTAIHLNGMPRAYKPRRTSRAGNECHLPMGGSPLLKNYDNRPFSTTANDGDYDESACQCTESATPANRSIAKCNSTDPYRVDDDGGWEPIGYPYKLRCGPYAPKRYEIRCGVSHQSSTALYAEVLTNQSYEIRRGIYTKAAGC